jgi:MoaA/NifB/PqqE/SkfB family radical SAM enzyme
MTKLFFLPDGVVHRCYKLVDDLTLCGKDLKRTSLAEAWHDPGFASVISPPLPRYKESTCGTCGRFGDCHSEGRCVYESSIANGTYFGKDRSCEGPFTNGELVQLSASPEVHQHH